MSMMNAGSIAEDRLGQYRIVRTIYPGVTSMVMEAVQDSTGKRFAIKQLLESRASDMSERRAFEHEGRLGLALHHPNLVRYHEYVKHPDGPFFVMDYFPGTQLKVAISKPKEFPSVKSQLHRIITQAGGALAYIHERGWVHRDVKPENIMANRTGEVRLIDYTLTQRPVTGLGSLFKKKMKLRQGTPSYMAPEQIQLATPNAAADIYSFAITCYELAAGRPPFRANSTSELLNKHLKEPPVPPTMHNKDITPEFSELLVQSLRKKPDQRPESMREFLGRFSRLRVYKDDPPVAGRDGF